MSKVRVAAFGVSLDGFGAGPNQSLTQPLGERGGELMGWFFPTRVFHAMHGSDAGVAGSVDDTFAQHSFENVGAWILGRNMFGPVRGEWPAETWKGWWGDEPPYHLPVFVLTHYPREPLVMQGGTTFHFVTEGIHKALELAKQAADGKDVRIGGGPHTIRQYLQEGLIDELHIAVGPVLLGQGEPLFDGIDLAALGYKVQETTAGEGAIHYLLTR
jgi:dihydrofolate reductase